MVGASNPTHALFSIANSKNASVVNTIRINSSRYYSDYLCESSLKANVATDEGKYRNET